MRKAVEQETLQALVETGAAREFRVLRGDDTWRLEQVACPCAQGAYR